MSEETKVTEEKKDSVGNDELEALKAELEALRKKNTEEIKALKKELAEEKKKSAALPVPDVMPVDDGNELVTIKLFKDNNKYKDDVFVGVNGETCLIRRGVAVQVKRKFADVLAESMRQDEETAAMIERESTDYAEQAKRYNV